MNPNPQNPSMKLGVKSPNAENEEKILAFWREQNIFKKTLQKDSPKGEYNFFEGPPTANGKPGIHHVAARSFKDIIPRYKTMQGFSVKRKAGWDTHGLPVELQVEKQLGLKSKKEIEEFGVAEFNKKCKESVWTYREDWEKLTERMAYWVDMEHPYVTYENSYIEAVWSVVKRTDERGHLYKDFRVGPWCTRCQTTLATHELNQPGAYKDIKDLSVFVKFPIVGFDKAYFLAWTTTPWTLPGNVGLAVGENIEYVKFSFLSGKTSESIEKETLIFSKELYEKIKNNKVHDFRGPLGLPSFHSGDSEYEVAQNKEWDDSVFLKEPEIVLGKDLVGLEYEPLYPFMMDLLPEHQHAKRENAYKVYAADFVTTTDGTGIVHTAVMYGADDFELGTKVHLPKFHLVNEEGKFIAGCDTETLNLSGRYVKETDENGKPTLTVDIINDLTARGLLFKKENYLHSYPHCWRCNTPLIYYARTSWYFNMSKLRQQLLDANEKINWEPEHIKEGRFGEWLDGIKDWAISRDRYWGTPLPVWETGDKKHKVVISGIEDVKKYAKKSGNKYFVMRHGQAENNVEEFYHKDRYGKALLTEEGKKQVLESAKNFKEKIDLVICSPYHRTRETAEILCNQIDFTGEIIYDKRIEEWETTTLFNDKPHSEFAQYYHYDYLKEPTKALQDAESFADMVKRVGDFIFDIEKQYEGKNIFIVTHSGTMRAFEFIQRGSSFIDLVKKEYFLEVPTNAEICELDFVPLPHNENYELDFHKPYIDQVELELDGEKLYRTPEVMDVWFDSGSMPIAQDHILGGSVNFDPAPADYIAEGVDQTRGWFYTMHAIANMLHDAPTEAYKNVLCMGLLLDANGVKMSKSRGNIVEPWAMFDKYGADVVRFWFYCVNQPGDSKNFDEKSLDEVNKKVFNPLRNVVSFYEMYSGESVNVDPRESKNVLDKWIITLLDNLVKAVSYGLEKYQVLEPSRAIRDVVGELSTWYIRRSRDRFKSDNIEDKNFAIATTRYVLLELSKIMAPFTPFLAEEVFQKLRTNENAESVHLEKFPEVKLCGTAFLEIMSDVRDLVTLGLDARTKSNIKVRQPLAKLWIPKIELGQEYLEIIKDELNVKEIVQDENLNDGEVKLDTQITEELREEGIIRELMRAIQERRKKEEFIPEDRPMLILADWEQKEGNILIEKYKDEIIKKTGLAGLVFGEPTAKDGTVVPANVIGEEGVVFQFELRK